MKLNITLLTIISFIVLSNAGYAQNPLLRPGKIIQKKLLKNQRDVFTLSLEKGGYVELVVLQKGVDAAIDVLDPSGKKIKTFDSPNGTDGPEPVSFVATSTGKYQMLVYPLIDETVSIPEKENLAEKIKAVMKLIMSASYQ